jgi:hypothetical protein
LPDVDPLAEPSTPDTRALTVGNTYDGPTLKWYEQVNPNWCVAACGQMVLEYHDMIQNQPDLATAFGHYDRLNKPKKLPNEAAAVAKVAAYLVSQSRQEQTCPTKDLASVPVPSPTWNDFKTHVRGGPLVRFTTGHAVVVAGFSSQVAGGIETARMFRVYDPEKGEMLVSADAPTSWYLCSAECETHVN